MIRIKLLPITLLLVLMLLLGLPGVSQAAESWASDPVTGTKVGLVHHFYTITAATWSGPAADGKAQGKGQFTCTLLGIDGKKYLGQGEAEMQAGLLNGHVTFKFTDGDTFDGTYENGQATGKGTYFFADRGRIYSGEFKDNLPEGFGTYKEVSGKVIYEGQWVNGNPANRPMLDKVLGIAWGASEEETKKIITARPKTSLQGTQKINEHIIEQRYWGPFNGTDQWIFFRFYDGKMYLAGMVQQFAENKLDLLMEGFDNARKGLTERYGPADIEKGKYVDAKLAWSWSGKYGAILSAERLTGNPPSFMLRLVYFEGPTYYKAESYNSPANTNEY